MTKVEKLAAEKAAAESQVSNTNETIDLSEIDEMIKENEEQSEYPDSHENIAYRFWLKELKNRLLSK